MCTWISLYDQNSIKGKLKMHACNFEGILGCTFNGHYSQ